MNEHSLTRITISILPCKLLYHSDPLTSSLLTTRRWLNELQPLHTTYNDKPKVTEIKPESIVQVKSYVNLQPLGTIPPFPTAFAPTATDLDGFLPIDPDSNASQQGHQDCMNTLTTPMDAWPQWPATGSTASTEQSWQWLQNSSPAKRTASTSTSTSAETISDSKNSQ